jgi:hypothetical protein
MVHRLSPRAAHGAGCTAVLIDEQVAVRAEWPRLGRAPAAVPSGWAPQLQATGSRGVIDRAFEAKLAVGSRAHR